ncbi:COMM domain-containing protein 3 [Teleopsis dalmanni]|uniref:COMM domain-containing protein 3 n=1 Tax=Teleopsis dalmanni TaxID=139649 RepID=UPI0018CDD207|nr:COMM domain-containing protein 3 [Teleopsis dalmanni]
MAFELSTSVVQGLQSLGTIIPIDLTKKLISNSIKLTLHSDETIPPVPEMYALNGDKTKQSEYAIVALFALATKHCIDSIALRHLLTKHLIDTTVLDELTRAYEENRKDLILRQLQLGFNFPHITDVEWRIICDVKSSTTNNSTGELGFLINLGRYHLISGEREHIVELFCNTEELQSLINKLKEIERHCEKVASQ